MASAARRTSLRWCRRPRNATRDPRTQRHPARACAAGSRAPSPPRSRAPSHAHPAVEPQTKPSRPARCGSRQAAADDLAARRAGTSDRSQARPPSRRVVVAGSRSTGIGSRHRVGRPAIPLTDSQQFVLRNPRTKSPCRPFGNHSMVSMAVAAAVPRPTVATRTASGGIRPPAPGTARPRATRRPGTDAFEVSANGALSSRDRTRAGAARQRTSPATIGVRGRGTALARSPDRERSTPAARRCDLGQGCNRHTAEPHSFTAVI
jgi:hypothetical protein